MTRSSTTPFRCTGRRVVLLLLGTWFLANALTHLIVAAATGGMYYQLPYLGRVGAEASISFLNFLLPILALRYVLHRSVRFDLDFAWKWTGWKIGAFSVCGFLVFMVLLATTNWLFGNRTIQYAAPGMAGPTTRLDYVITTLMLLIFPALGEETMFRGFLQTRLTAMYGARTGILVPAILFSVRHHPSDVYFAVLNHVPLQGWLNRGVQLYLGAVIFGVVRHVADSTWASWAMHMMMIVLILVLGGFLRGVWGG